MSKKLDPSAATEGEWIVQPIKINHCGARTATFAVLATGGDVEEFVGRIQPRIPGLDERHIMEMDARLFAASKAMATLLLQALAYEEDAFRLGMPVDGGDLVQWFAEWRQHVRQLLEAAATDWT